jgi:peptidoglycan/LPS O-acetylase OafA/YrhL
MGDKIRKRGALLFVLVVPIIKLALYAHPVEWITQLTIFHRIDSIALGCLIALHKNVILKLLNRRFEVIFFISLSVLFLLRYLQPLSAGYNLHLGFIVVAFGSTSGTIANLCIGVIVLYSVFGPHGVWSRLLNSKVLNYIGLLSYSLYLWQQLFLTGKEFWWSSLPLNLVFIAGSALFSYYCIEKPFLKLRDKLEKPSPIRKKVKSNSKDLALVFVAE